MTRRRDVDLIREQIRRLGAEAYADPHGLRWRVTVERLISEAQPNPTRPTKGGPMPGERPPTLTTEEELQKTEKEIEETRAARRKVARGVRVSDLYMHRHYTRELSGLLGRLDALQERLKEEEATQ